MSLQERLKQAHSKVGPSTHHTIGNIASVV